MKLDGRHRGRQNRTEGIRRGKNEKKKNEVRERKIEKERGIKETRDEIRNTNEKKEVR